MSFEWDPGKAVANRIRHGVDMADATSVFFDHLAITLPDEGAIEERFVTMGLDLLGRVLVVVFTWRGDDIRIISARKATRFERRQYEEGP